jgi:hypothetical protein
MRVGDISLSEPETPNRLYPGGDSQCEPVDREPHRLRVRAKFPSNPFPFQKAAQVFCRRAVRAPQPARPCRCERCQTAGGPADPLPSIFKTAGALEIREIISRAQENLQNIQSTQCQALYRDHPFQDSPDFSAKVIEILNGEDCRYLLEIAAQR